MYSLYFEILATIELFALAFNWTIYKIENGALFSTWQGHTHTYWSEARFILWYNRWTRFVTNLNIWSNAVKYRDCSLIAHLFLSYHLTQVLWFIQIKVFKLRSQAGCGSGSFGRTCILNKGLYPVWTSWFKILLNLNFSLYLLIKLY